MLSIYYFISVGLAERLGCLTVNPGIAGYYKSLCPKPIEIYAFMRIMTIDFKATDHNFVRKCYLKNSCKSLYLYSK